VKSRLAARGIDLQLTTEAKDFIIDAGFNPDFGARPLRRSIERLIEDPLSEEILRGALKDVSVVRVVVADKRLAFEPQGAQEAREEVGASSSEGTDSGETTP